MTRAARAIVLVLDSVGVGALPDAADYGDEGADTLGNTARAVGGLRMPNLGAMGLGNLSEVLGVPPVPAPIGSWGRARELSPGKDTTTGHWEMMGVTLERPFPVYPDGFPAEVMEEFSRVTGRGWLGNEPASGTEIIQRLGDAHVASGDPIVYTSADSVFQVAAHEGVIPVEELYAVCEAARMMLVGEHAVGRVIARPFAGPDPEGRYVRTHRRRDFALPPTGRTALDSLADAGVPVHGIGKIGEIFAWRGVRESPHVTDNMDALDKTVERVASEEPGLVFANLVDFDMLWGHRNDAPAYAAGLEAVDARIPELLGAMVPGDLLVVTADHGCDPTTPSTDHSREHAPLLVKVSGVDAGVDLGVRETFADVGATLLHFYGSSERPGGGRSFLGETLAARR
ncbi:MAG: phosphopentomutase [Coriobacteriia bacterium]|nr:phosphopentomutase [Coriobacteriia bacterium]